MTFESRMAAIFSAVRTMLERFTPPKAFTEDHQVAELRAISQALNSRLPSTDEASFHALLADVLQSVGENARTRAWPTTGEFVAGWEAIQARRKAANVQAVETDELTAVDQFAVEKLMEGLSQRKCFHWLVNEKRVIEMERRGADLWDMHTVGIRLTRDQDRRLANMPRSNLAAAHREQKWARLWGVDQREARRRLAAREDEKTGQTPGQLKQMAKVFA